MMPPEYINQIVTGDARLLAERIPDASVDLIFTDPPYPREYLPLYGWLAETAARVLKPGGSLVAMAGHYYLPDVMQLIAPYLDYQWTIAHTQIGGTARRVWPRRINAFWKPVLWYVKGVYTGNWIGDIVQSPSGDKRFHEWGQSAAGAIQFITKFSRVGDLLWEPFSGGGTVPAVCKMLDRNYIAFEIDAPTAARARARVEATQAMHPVFLEEQQPMGLAS